jgi:phosphonate transport system permease protein
MSAHPVAAGRSEASTGGVNRMGTALAREWHRFTPAERIGRWLVWLAIVASLVWAVRSVEIIPEFLEDAPEQMADLLVRMWPPDLAHYYPSVHAALIETLHIATLGTLFSFVLAIPLALLAARNICRIPVLNGLAQLLLVSSRSVNSLVWALIFVAVFGPGAAAGTFAIAFRSVGFVGKLLAEALEETNRGPVEALTAAGAPWGSVMLKGVWPQVQPAFWGIALFRWDINVRESAVLGLVGAGGIGVVLDDAINFFQWERVATVLLAILAVVIIAEIVVTRIRSKLI